LKAGTYIGSTGVNNVHIQGYDGNKYYDFSKAVTLDVDIDKLSLYVQVSKGNTTTFLNTIIYPMLNRGTTAVPYKPYRGTLDTLPISAELRAFLEDKGYGRGVEGYYGYIDFENKLFYPPRTYRMVFDGTEKWEAATAVPQGSTDTGIKRMLFRLNFARAKKIDVRTIAPMICNLYNTDTLENTWYCINNTCSCNDVSLYVYDEAYNTADSVTAWEAHLAHLYASGNPLIVEYATEDVPEPIDISAYITDEFIQVEGGGAIVPVNPEYNNPAFVECMFTELK
jgi:hypothetical protein